jgi:hypothetical protein
MMKKTAIVLALCVWTVLIAKPAISQESATLTLRSGERISGDLVDLGGVGYSIRVNGQDRNIGGNDVAVIAFTGGDPNADLVARLRNGEQLVVLRNGQVLQGRLSDIGGTHPLRLTIDTPSGSRDLTSNDVAQIYFAVPPGLASVSPSPAQVGTAGQIASATAAGGTVRVDANQSWIDTGLNVGRFERIAFNVGGTIEVAPGASAGPGGNTSVQRGNYPVRNAPAGALIGRIGNGSPFLIGTNSEMRMPGAGRLMLGINDDGFNDNSGSFSVNISRR